MSVVRSIKTFESLTCSSWAAFKDTTVEINSPSTGRLSFSIEITLGLDDGIQVSGICFHEPTRSLFLADQNNKCIIRVYVSQGDIAGSQEIFFRDGPLALNGRSTLSIGADGWLYCCDYFGDRIIRWNLSTSEDPTIFLRRVKPSYVAADSNENYCLCYNNRCYLMIDSVEFEIQFGFVVTQVFFEKDFVIFARENGKCKRSSF